MTKTMPVIEPGSRMSLKRLQILTDCVFALSLILLVFFINKPPEDMMNTEDAIQKYLFGELDLVLAYLVTFINISFYWFFTHNQSKYVIRSSGTHAWLTLGSLMFVGLMPYAGGLNEAFPNSFTIHIFYSSVVFLVGLLFAIDWVYATRQGRLVDRETGHGAVEELIVESCVQPGAALLSMVGAFIGTLWWQIPFLMVPVATFVISKCWYRRRIKSSSQKQQI